MKSIQNCKNLFGANMGLEKECLRVREDAMLAKTRHPFQNDKNIKMDFAEPQTEIATEPCGSADALYTSLFGLHKKAACAAFRMNELLWGLSNPPLFGREEDIPIAVFENDPEETEFRRQLAEKYGRKIMLYSGIHFNFSYSDKLISELFCKSGASEKREFKDSLYLSVAKNCFKYVWFPVFLTAASPVYDSTFAGGEDKYGGKFCGYASMRNSPFGYKNPLPLPLDLSSAQNYVKRVRSLVDEKRLMHISELYSPVRIKAKKGHSTTAILNDGIDFLELRVFDLNPFSPCGFAKDDIRFLHLFMIYLLSLDDFEFTEARQKAAEQNKFAAAKFEPGPELIDFDLNGEKQPLIQAAKELAGRMKAFFKDFDNGAPELLDRVFSRIYDPSRRYAVRLANSGREYIKYGLELSEKQLDAVLNAEENRRTKLQK